MKTYYFELMDKNNNSYNVLIPEGQSKTKASAQARRIMRALGIKEAVLAIRAYKGADIQASTIIR